jgi:hypothetical protein
MKAYVASGRPIIFFPPKQTGTNQLFGMKWERWNQLNDQPLGIESWRSDSDLLRHTRSGLPLPVGELLTHQFCTVSGDGTVLARLEGGQPFLIRAASDGGPVYFFATLPHGEHSSLAQQGVVFYVIVQRALSLGAATQGSARQWATGARPAHEVERWKPFTSAPVGVLSSERSFHAGVFQDGDKLIALNRPAAEDEPATLDDAAIGRLFSGLEYRQINDRVGDSTSLASETWRAFLVAMAVAMLLEAWLCLPQRHPRTTEAA